jgi:hypothetical protein
MRGKVTWATLIGCTLLSLRPRSCSGAKGDSQAFLVLLRTPVHVTARLPVGVQWWQRRRTVNRWLAAQVVQRGEGRLAGLSCVIQDSGACDGALACRRAMVAKASH